MVKDETVVLTKEQSDALEKWIRDVGRDSVMRICAVINDGFASDPSLNCLKVNKMARALYVGYTVEKTQEDREANVKVHYESKLAKAERAKDFGEYNEYNELIGECRGILSSLDILCIKISGVNV